MRRTQIEWRRKHFPKMQKLGRQNGRDYEHILPECDRWLNLWKGIQDELPSYLIKNDIQRHSGMHNLLSSWTLCANLYFPFRNSPEGLALLTGFLKSQVHPDINAVTTVTLEYAEEGHCSPAELLGEKAGRRGSGQTSPDVAFLVKTANDKRGVVLVESKFTEGSFYTCSARRRAAAGSRVGNPDPSRCFDVTSLLATPRQRCHQYVWGRTYFKHLLPVVAEEGWATLSCCPAAKSGYQLLRQQALAEGLANSSQFDLVLSCVAYDARNETLCKSLSRMGIDGGLEDGWQSLFRGKAKFKTYTHQSWVAWVRRNDQGRHWRDWLDYVAGRYGYVG